MLVALLLGAIVLGTVEMGRQLVATALEPPYLLIEPAALFHSFGQFLIILIGLELLKVLKLHLQHQKLPPQVVLEVAVIAVCNKVLTVDAHELDGLSIIGIAALVLALTAGYWLFVRARQGRLMATFVVAHGAWSAGWAWKKMRPLLRAKGHELFTPTYTGVGERAHLASPEVGLETHIQDILAVLEAEDLQDIVLVGHSYGGMVATGVADRAAARIRHLVYLDAFVPRDGHSLLDLQAPEARSRMREAVKTQGEGWRLPPNPMPPDTAPEDVAWAMPRRVMQPAKTFEQAARLTGAVERLPRTYIYCKRAGPGDVFRQFADRARAEKGWTLHEIDASHNPHITIPETLAAILHGVAAR